MHPSRGKTIKRVHKMTRIRKIRHKQSLKNGHKMLPIIIKNEKWVHFSHVQGINEHKPGSFLLLRNELAPLLRCRRPQQPAFVKTALYKAAARHAEMPVNTS